MIDHENKICFIHIPKTAGQSIESWLMDLRGLNVNNLEHRELMYLGKNDFSSGLPRTASHYSYSDIRDVVFDGAIPDDYRLFAVVRDPIARLRSELSYRFNGRIPPRVLLAMRSLPIRRVFDDFRCHLQTQSSFLEGAPDGRIRVLRLENLASDFSALTEEFGLPNIPLPNVNRSRGNRPPLPQSVVDWGMATYAVDCERFGYPLTELKSTAIS